MINPPPNQQAIQEQNRPGIANAWMIFFSNVFSAIQAMQSSGTTAQRPTRGLWIGRPYFDTTLGIPVWYNGANWVNSSGSTV